MSLSLLNNYGSSSDESDEDEKSTANPPISNLVDSAEKPIVNEVIEEEQESRNDDQREEGKNFFEADSSDDDEDDGEFGQIQSDQSTNSAAFIGPSLMPTTYTYDAPVGPSYDPTAHPSQMYNYASYSSTDYRSESSGGGEFIDQSSAVDNDEEQAAGPSSWNTKRQRTNQRLTDNDAKKIIQKFEMDSMGLAMPDNLEIIDANVDSHLGPNVREHLVKNITIVSRKETTAAALDALRESPAPDQQQQDGGEASGSSNGRKRKNKKNQDPNDPGQLAKRKHQITYLAYMAKANEEKLQNEWAKNRLTKRQTQAKYGF